MKKKILSLMLCLTTVLGMCTLASATELDPNGVYETASGITKGVSDIRLEVVEFEPILIATVPIELPIIVDTKGQVTVPSDAKIVNNSDQALKVTNIDVFLNEGWTTGAGLNDTTGNSAAKQMAFTFRGDGQQSSDGSNIMLKSNWTIPANGELPLDIQAVVSKGARTEVKAAESVGSVQFIIAFAN